MFLVSFANFSSVGIIAGAVKGLNEEQGNVVSRFGLKLVYGSTLVSVLSASIAALGALRPYIKKAGILPGFFTPVNQLMAAGDQSNTLADIAPQLMQ